MVFLFSSRDGASLGSAYMLAKVNLFLYLFFVRMSGRPSLIAAGVYGTFGSSILGLWPLRLLSLGDPDITIESLITNGNCLEFISSLGDTLTCEIPVSIIGAP